jgi:hypothetical protein
LLPARQQSSSLQWAPALNAGNANPWPPNNIAISLRRHPVKQNLVATLCQIAGVATLLTALAIGVLALDQLNSANLPRSQRITCLNNLKQIGLAFKTWALDNQDHFPFNVGTNAGGTMELCAESNGGFDSSAFQHFQVMSNELGTPRILVCPKDRSRKPASDFQYLHAANVTYLLFSGTNVTDAHPQEILAKCPIDGNTLYCDGSVTKANEPHEWRRPAMMSLMEVNPKFSLRVWGGIIALLAGSGLFFIGIRLRR